MLLAPFFPRENSAVILLFVLLYITLLFSQAVSLTVFQTGWWERAQFPGLGAQQTLFPLILSGESCSSSSSFPHPCHSQCWAACSRGSTEVPVFFAASALLSGVPACDFQMLWSSWTLSSVSSNQGIHWALPWFPPDAWQGNSSQGRKRATVGPIWFISPLSEITVPHCLVVSVYLVHIYCPFSDFDFFFLSVLF